MKNHIILITAIVLVFCAVGCVADAESNILDSGLKEQNSLQKIQITATAADNAPDTKTARIGQDFYWSPGDQISLFYGPGENGGSQFTSTNTEYATRTIFEGMINVFTGLTEESDAIKFWGIFPYDENSSCIDGGASLITTIQANQETAHNSWGNTQSVCLGRSKGLAMSFYNLCGGIKFCLSQEGINKITFRGNGNQTLAGQVKVLMDNENHPVIDQFMGDAKEITLTTDGNFTPISGTDTTWYFLIVPPTTFENGFTFTLTKENGQTATKEVTASRTVSRNVFGVMRTPIDKGLEFVSDEPIVFQDNNFKAYCVQNFDKNGDGEVTILESESVTSITVNTEVIASLKGIEYFKKLKTLKCQPEWKRMKEDSEGVWHLYNAAGEEVIGLLTSLDLSGNPLLQTLECEGNQLNSIDLSKNTALRTFRCSYNQLTTLDLSNNTALSYLMCYNNQFTALDLSNNADLKYLSCQNNLLTSLDLSNNTLLSSLSCSNNQLTSLDLSNNPALGSLSCHKNQLTSLNISSCTALNSLICVDNQLVSLNLSNNNALEVIRCYNNQLTSLTVSKDSQLKIIVCHDNQLTSLDLSDSPLLETVDCYENNLISLNVSDCPKLKELQCNENQLAELILTNTPDLELLRCYFNKLTSLDLSNHTKLQQLAAFGNELTSLNLTGDIALTYLACGQNELSDLNVSSNTALIELQCIGNHLKSLDVSTNTALSILACSSNDLTSINVNNNTSLTKLDCSFNEIPSLDVSNNPLLEILSCYYNKLTTLDVSYNPLLKELNCSFNPMTTLYLKQGQEQTLTSINKPQDTNIEYK